MQIYLNYNIQKDDMPEFLLLEMQGSIESEAEELSGMVLGEIQKGLQDKIILEIGIHRISGSVIELKKPLILAKKSKNVDGEIELKVHGICKKKILFNQRPTPVLDNVTKKTKQSNILPKFVCS